MLHKLNFSNKFQTVKIFALGFLVGTVITALSLDNRLGALKKAFMNPTAINGMSISMEVIKK